MKTKILIFLFVSVVGYAQNHKVQMLTHKTMTTAQRDAYTVPAGEYPQIYNSTTDQVEAWDGNSWQALSQSTRLYDFTVSQKVNGIFGLSPNDGEIIFEYAGVDVTNILFDEAFSKYLVEFETLIGAKSINAVIFNKTQEKTLIGDITAITANDVGGTDYYSTSIELGDMAETDIAVNDEIEVYLGVNENLSNYADKTANNTFTGTQQNFNGKIGLNDATPTTPLTVIHDSPDQTSNQILASFSDQDLSEGTGVSGVLLGTLSNGTNTYGGYVASQGYEPLYLGTLTSRNSLQIADNGTVTAPNMTTGEIDTAGNKALITKEYADANYAGAGSDTSEWANSTGTGVGGDLTLSLGNVDNSGNGTKIFIDDSAYLINVSGGVEFGDNIVANQGVDMSSSKITNLLDPTSAQDAATKAYVDANAGSGHTIQEEGVNITQKDTLNFTGAGVSVANVGDVTTVTINGAAPLETTSTTIDLSNTTNNYGFATTPSTSNSFSVNVGTVVTGGKANYLIDTTGDTDYPTVTNSTLINSAPFEANAIFDMFVENNGNQTFHYFVKRDISPKPEKSIRFGGMYGFDNTGEWIAPSIRSGVHDGNHDYHVTRTARGTGAAPAYTFEDRPIFIIPEGATITRIEVYGNLQNESEIVDIELSISALGDDLVTGVTAATLDEDVIYAPTAIGIDSGTAKKLVSIDLTDYTATKRKAIVHAVRPTGTILGAARLAYLDFEIFYTE